MVVLGFALIAVSAPAWGQEQGAKDVAAASASKAQKDVRRGLRTMRTGPLLI